MIGLSLCLFLPNGLLNYILSLRLRFKKNFPDHFLSSLKKPRNVSASKQVIIFMPGTSDLTLREHPEDMARARAGKLHAWTEL